MRGRPRPLLGVALAGAVLCGTVGWAAAVTENADDFLIVDCLLPAQIRQLGQNMTFLAPRQAVRAAAHDCALRGGEFSRGDAGGPAGLQMWLPQAQRGDPVAQTYVGEIFERGLAGQPDYAAAAVWYRRAVDQGNSRAAIALGTLLQQGLGAPKDPIAAAKLFRRAAGLPEDLPGDDNRVKELSSQLAAANASGAATQKKLDEQTRQLNDLRKRLGQRQSEAQHERDSLAALQSRLAAQQQHAPAAATPDPAAQQAAREAAAQRDRDVAAAKAQVDQLRTKLAALEQAKQGADPAKLGQLQGDLETARNAQAAQQQEAARLRQQLQAAQQADAARDQSTQGLTKSLAEREHDLAGTKNQVDQLRAQLATLEGARQQQQTVDQSQIDKLHGDIDGARAAMTAQQQQADTLKQQLQAAQQASAARDQATQGLTKSLAEREHDLAGTKSQVDQLRTQVASLEGARQTQQTVDQSQIDKLRGDLDSARTAMTAQQQEADRLHKELRETQQTGGAREKELNRTVDQLQHDVTARQAALAARDAEIERLKTQVAKLDTTRSLEPSAPADAAPPPFAIAEFGRYHALVIGINNYTKLPPLKTPIDDAKAVAQVLRDDYGFDVVTLVDADRYQILSALNKLRQSLTDKDNLLIYYAGHGEADRVNQRGNWLPVDAERDSSANWISNVQITDILNAMAAQQILVVADSCYSGTLTRDVAASLEHSQSDTERVKWYKVMMSKPSRVAMTSGGIEPVADAGGGGHSLFASLLLKVLTANKSVLAAQEVYSRIQPAVATGDNTKTIQVPEYAPIKMAGHEAGDFLFVRHETRAQ